MLLYVSKQINKGINKIINIMAYFICFFFICLIISISSELIGISIGKKFITNRKIKLSIIISDNKEGIKYSDLLKKSLGKRYKFKIYSNIEKLQNFGILISDNIDELRKLNQKNKLAPINPNDIISSEILRKKLEFLENDTILKIIDKNLFIAIRANQNDELKFKILNNLENIILLL